MPPPVSFTSLPLLPPLPPLPSVRIGERERNQLESFERPNSNGCLILTRLIDVFVCVGGREPLPAFNSVKRSQTWLSIHKILSLSSLFLCLPHSLSLPTRRGEGEKAKGIDRLTDGSAEINISIFTLTQPNN